MRWGGGGRSVVGARRLKAHVTMEKTEDGLALVRFDAPDSKVNTLGEQVVNDFTAVLDRFEGDPSAKAMVLLSGKRDNFIAGADINQLSACKSVSDLEALSERGKALLGRLEKSSRPVVAAINGKCLGGGLEVALACHHRLATTDATLALPEVMLGLLPGAGGTQRLPALVGTPTALDMMLTGKNIPAPRAKKMGLVDTVVDTNALENSALQAARGLVAGTVKKSKPKKNRMTRFLEAPVVRDKLTFAKARETVLKKTRGNYPAPLAIIDCVQEGLNSGATRGYEVESRRFGELGMTPESKALVSLFHAQTACKKNPYDHVPFRPAQKLGVIGAGLMGAGIAEVSIARGMDVVLKDQTDEALSRGYGHIYANLQRKVKRKRMAQFDAEKVMSRLHAGVASRPETERLFSDVDVIIEAVFEKLELKQSVLAGLEKLVPAHCVIASNTSQIPIHKIAAACSRPERVLGMHYFSPVDKMQLLEIITTDKTSDEATAIAVDAGLRQGKAVIVVGDGPGFYTTRILAPYMAEFFSLLQATGISPKKLDSLLMDVGFPVGPATLADEVGLDVAQHVSQDLGQAFGERMGGGGTDLLNYMVNDLECLGRKNKKGFFLYEKKKPGFLQSLMGKKPKRDLNPKVLEYLSRHSNKDQVSEDDMKIRMLSRMVNEAVLCLQEGILKQPVDGDFGAVFGLGFPPFLGGGPFRFVDSYGADKLVDKMSSLRDSHGVQFDPCDLLKDHAKSGQKFYKE
mmetsp:Transcript_4147/g.11582  ORF Transcript_4147/g.11582 Transcript_4147/m.11582 type:complete len:744 (+) Transcript_4147:2-2233(+)